MSGVIDLSAPDVTPTPAARAIGIAAAWVAGWSGIVLAMAGPAWAGPADDHSCAGTTVSSLAGPGFGGGVSTAAQGQLVDNFGLADCGQTNRNNP